MGVLLGMVGFVLGLMLSASRQEGHRNRKRDCAGGGAHEYDNAPLHW